ncbi:MAG: hypothetical protein KBA61_03425 [Spirochaetes bacterium]|nr:hypothetical protein [Spirochaetota bacterium]
MMTVKEVCLYGVKDYYIRSDPGEPIPKVSPPQVKKCREFIRVHLKPHRRGRSSYHFKHAVERVYGGYYANGSFIAAAILEGCEVERIGLGPNVIVKMDYKDRATKIMCNG